jgi:hypothetical protein
MIFAMFAAGCASIGASHRSASLMNGITVGMTQQQVVDVMGAPDTKISAAGLECYQYELYLGNHRTIPTSHAIYFDRSGRVAEFNANICHDVDLRKIASH